MSGFRDDFSTLDAVHACASLDRPRRYPRIPVRPDVRVNRRDPAEYTYDGRPVGYGWFPTVCRLHSGALLCGFREGAAHVFSPDGRSVVSRSEDGGRTWSEAVVVYDPPDYTSGVCGLGQTSDGRLWMAIENQRLAWPEHGPGDPRAWLDYQAVLSSADDGRTWQEAWRGEPVPGVDKSFHLFCPHELSNGDLLWMAAASDERGEPIRATAVQREVGGRLDFEVRPHPELGPTSDEPALVETRRPGELVVVMRQQQHGRYYATSRSLDYGRTWSDWRMSNIYIGPCPTRPFLRRMEDGTLLCCHGQRWIGRTFVVPSHDDGETWDTRHRQVILHSPEEYHLHWDSHYTDMARAEGCVWVAVDYVATPRRRPQKGLYATFVDSAFFRDVHGGLRLAQRGTSVWPETRGLWSFDEEDGDFAHDGVGSNYGEIRGARRVDGGRLGRCLSFDGDGCVMIYDDASLWVAKYFTLEAWIRTPEPGRDQTILSKAPRYTFGLKDGRPCLQIGAGEMTADMDEPLAADRWYHLAVTYGMRRMYSRATFYVDGREVCWASPTHDGEAGSTYAEAVALTDMQIAEGPLFQESYAPKNASTDNLVIGMDNDLRGRPFVGLIDEVAVHGVDLEPGQIALSASRALLPAGRVRSVPLSRPPGQAWSRFRARTSVPDGTSIRLRIEDAGGRVLREVEDGADLSGIEAEVVVLGAELRGAGSGPSPVLHEWSLEAAGSGPVAVLAPPFPDQTAPESTEADDGPAAKEVLL